MNTYFVSLALGVFVGAIYGSVSVRSPAPPLIALIGLAGMLIGEQLVVWARSRVFDVRAVTHIADYRPRDHVPVIGVGAVSRTSARESRK
jgi:XapX domain-containing protein